VYFFIFIRPHF